MSQRGDASHAGVAFSMAGRGEREGGEGEGGRRELAAVRPRPLLHSPSFRHDCKALVNDRRLLVLARRKRYQGGSDRTSRAARLTWFRPAPRAVFLFGMAGPNEADAVRVDALLKRMAVTCDEKERETLLRETAAL